MKIKEGFIKRQVGERVVVVPIGEAAQKSMKTFLRKLREAGVLEE